MPNSSPERAPANPGNHSPEHTGLRPPEVGVDAGSQERSIEQAREQLSGVGAGDASSSQVPVVLPVAPPPLLQNSAQSVPDDTPLVAADEDLIEREWVDKAKQIVVATRDDPYAQEREVSKLQADYLQKRYGKEIKLSNQ